MSTKEEPRPPLLKLITLNKGLKLAEQWVMNMPGELDETGEIDIESRPSGLGLGAKVPRKSQAGPINDPVERRLHMKFGMGRKKFCRDEDSNPSTKKEIQVGDEDEDEDDNLESRTNVFDRKRAAPLTTTPQAKKKHNY